MCFKKIYDKFENINFENKNIKCHLNIELKFMNIYDAATFDVNIKKIDYKDIINNTITHNTNNKLYNRYDFFWYIYIINI